MFSPILRVVFFVLFMVSSVVQELLSLIRSHWVIFVFITLGGVSKKISPWVMSKSVLCFPLSFMMSGLTFMSLIHFEFIFVCGVSVLISFFYINMMGF